MGILGDQAAPAWGDFWFAPRCLYLSPDVRQDRQCLFKSARELPPEGLSVLCCASLDFSLCPGSLCVGMFGPELKEIGRLSLLLNFRQLFDQIPGVLI